MQMLKMAVIFAVLGAATRLLRLKPVCPKFDNPKRSAICALIAVAVSMFVVTLLVAVSSSGHHQQVATHSAVRRYNVVPQLFLVVIYCLPMALMLRLNREALQSTGLTTANLWKSTLVGLFLGMVSLALGRGGPAAIVGRLDQPLAAYLFFGAIGFGEEYLFRGYLQTRLVAWLGQVWGWVLASAFMALAHVPSRAIAEGMDLPQALASSAGLILISLLCGFVMLRTGNVVAPAIFHAFADWPRH